MRASGYNRHGARVVHRRPAWETAQLGIAEVHAAFWEHRLEERVASDTSIGDTDSSHVEREAGISHHSIVIVEIA